MSISLRAAERAICRPLLRLAKLADKNPARLATLLGQPARLYNNKSGKKQKVDGGEWAFVGKAICDLSGGATEYAIPCREQRAAKVIRDHLEYLYHLGIPIIPEAAELIRRLQSAATLAIHLRAAEPDWSECLDSVISSSFAAPMDSDLAQMTSSQLQEERLDLEQLPPGAEPRVGDLLISHPLWSVLQAPFDYSVLLVAADGLTGVTGLRLNQPEGQTLEQLLVASDQELCRIHLGIHALRVRLNQLPTSWRSNVAQTAGRFQLPGVLGDGADVIGSYADGGLMASLYQAGNRVEDYMGRYQPMRIGHIALLKEDLLGKDKTQKSLMKQVRDTRTALDRVYSIGPERVEGLLEKASKIRHPRRFWRRKPRRNLHLVELWAAASSLSRTCTLVADREAVQAMGNIDGLAGGLVLLHGTATQKRQLQRRELRSLLEDAQADFPANQRWPLWFEAFTKGSMEPVLILRLAELRDLEEKYGWKAASPSWWTWFMSWFGR